MGDLVIDLEKPYGLLATCAGFFGLGAYILLGKAESNDRGLIINGLIHLEPGGADLFYAVLGLFSLAFVLVALKATFELATRKRFQVTLDGERIQFPDPMLIRAGADRVLDYADIESVHVGDFGSGKRSMKVVAAGREHYVSSRFLPARWPIDLLARELTTRVRLARGTDPGQASPP